MDFLLYILSLTREMATPKKKTAAAPEVESDSVKVAVRVRPFNDREKAASLEPVVKMSPSNKTVTVKAPTNAVTFVFDHVLWSLGGKDADGTAAVGQPDVYLQLGSPLVDHAFNGFNSCLFAYGQTGSGKTFSMMGNDSDPGIIPRLCTELFERKRKREIAKPTSKWEITVGYIEVYNEKVSDLLAPRKPAASAKGKASEDAYCEIREHPKQGIFVDGQTIKPVASPEEILALISSGNDQRKTAATLMNASSSRSHAIFQLYVAEQRTMIINGVTSAEAGKSCRMNLVDLAGSERSATTGAQGEQAEQAKYINLSLTTLGRVIDVLADVSKNPLSPARPPYRDSKLTYLLKDSLGGNSKTVMLAAVSPSAMNTEETISTLRYASRARDIINVAKVNEDPLARRIRELEEEIQRMKSQGGALGGGGENGEAEDWGSGFCACGDERQSCLDVLCCFPCQVGRQCRALTPKPLTDDLPTDGGVDVPSCAITVCLAFVGLLALPAMILRYQVVTRFGMQPFEGAVATGVKGCLCFPCSLCQTHRELTRRGVSVGGTCFSPPVQTAIE